MNTKDKQDLIKNVIELNDDEKFQEVIKLLPDRLLNEEKDYKLYAEKSKAMFYLDKNGFEKYAKKSLALKENQEASYYLGIYYETMDDLSTAIEYYNKAIELDPNFILSYSSLGDIYTNQNSFEEGEKFYNKALNIDSNHLYTNHMLGNLYKKINKDVAAEKHYKIAIKKDDKYFYSYYGLGNIYLQRKEFENAVEMYEKAFSLNNDFYDAIFGLGIAYHRKKNYEKAIDYYNKYLKRYNNEIDAYNNLGNSYKSNNNFSQAEESYKKALEIDPLYEKPYFNYGNLLYKQEKYSDAKELLKKYLELKKEEDSLYEFAKTRIEKVNKILANEDYEKIQDIVSKIKEILEYKDNCITHFTSLSVAKLLVFESSKFRLSEGAFLNDTSEGRELFSFLNYQSPFGKKENPVDEIFVQKPFIGSFVSESKHNDLAMWRMYGKEGKDEAKGCAITMNVKTLIEQVQEKLGIDKLEESEFDIKFYKVAYWKDTKFIVADEKTSGVKIRRLNKYCNDLKNVLDEFNTKDEEIKIQIDIEELLFEIAFLFKGIEYQYENEVRLVQKGVGFDKTIDKTFIVPRVYIELSEISKSIEKITLGPKVERADEWASALHYELKNREIEAEIHISRQPFK
ncbi:tetratricopeptide repeat protein [Chryseobacterium sp. R2ACT005]|uniref:tetratricopeptide repeat protein n=1 Tax=Chryseobacterium sp. R2ACT005 TaxID=3416668 RepID=UPI003CEE53B0